MININQKEFDKFALAKQILDTPTSLKGVDYLLSREKRRFDGIVGGALTAGCLVPIVTLAALVWMQDRHNPLLSLTRRNPFTGHAVPYWKIRTMVPDAHKLEDAVLNGDTIADFKRRSKDPRVTPLGAAIRRTSLDELPQLIQAAKGDLSLVGPRVFSDTEWNNHVLTQTQRQPYQSFCQLIENGVRFGVTGFYGIMGRANLSLVDRLTLEVMYGERASMTADVKIIGLTVGAVLNGHGAY